MQNISLLSEDSQLFPPSYAWPSEPVSPVLSRALNGFLIPDSRLPKVNEAWTILETALVTTRSDHVFLLFSGGYDSLTATHLSMLLLQDTIRKYASHFGDRQPALHVLHVNTGIGVETTRDYVRQVSAAHQWHYLEYTTPESYEATVLHYGFPGPAQHFRMYSRLKERAIRLAIRDHTPTHPLAIHRSALNDLLNEMQHLPLRFQYVLLRLIRRFLAQAITAYHQDLRPILFVTGVRRSESVRRMGNVVPLQKHGRHLWASPLTSWSKEDTLTYRDTHNLPHNEVVDTLHKSGECLCGSFAKAGELEELCFWYPDVGRYIKDLERRVNANGFLWGWEEGPPRQKKKRFVHPGQLTLPGFDMDLTEEEPSFQGFRHSAPLALGWFPLLCGIL